MFKGGRSRTFSGTFSATASNNIQKVYSVAIQTDVQRGNVYPPCSQLFVCRRRNEITITQKDCASRLIAVFTDNTAGPGRFMCERDICLYVPSSYRFSAKSNALCLVGVTCHGNEFRNLNLPRKMLFRDSGKLFLSHILVALGNQIDQLYIVYKLSILLLLYFYIYIFCYFTVGPI